jgi:hypothetical protein
VAASNPGSKSITTRSRKWDLFEETLARAKQVGHH